MQRMAQSQWKLNRIAAIEVQLLAASLDPSSSDRSASAALALSFAAEECVSTALLKLNRYEASANRAYFQALKQLLAVQKERRAHEAQQLEQQRRLQELHTDQLLEAALTPPIAACKSNPIPNKPIVLTPMRDSLDDRIAEPDSADRYGHARAVGYAPEMPSDLP